MEDTSPIGNPDPDDEYRNGFAKHPSDTHILVMGRTGAGKSTLISQCTEDEVDSWAGLQPCTQSINVYRCDHIVDRHVYLVDSPGFDDNDRTDGEILKGIADWLSRSSKDGVKLGGVLYLYDVQTMKASGSLLERLRRFNQILGNGPQRSEVVKNLVFVTTMWNKLTEAAQTKAERRWKQLFTSNEFLGGLSKEGARDWKYLNSQESALEVIRSMLPSDESTVSSIFLDIQDEPVENKASAT